MRTEQRDVNWIQQLRSRTHTDQIVIGHHFINHWSDQASVPCGHWSHVVLLMLRINSRAIKIKIKLHDVAVSAIQNWNLTNTWFRLQAEEEQRLDLNLWLCSALLGDDVASWLPLYPGGWSWGGGGGCVTTCVCERSCIQKLATYRKIPEQMKMMTTTRPQWESWASEASAAHCST